MLKRLLVAAAFVVVAGSMVGVSTVNAKGDKGPKPEKGTVTICHRTNAPTNPYREIEVSKSAVDGKGKNDHTHHEGPVASSLAVAKALKKNKEKWGDIIPPFDSYPGNANWMTPEGAAIYGNHCKYLEPQIPAADVDFKLVCDVNNHQALITFTNDGDIEGSATVNGSEVKVPLTGAQVKVATTAAGTQIIIMIDQVKVYDELVKCEPGKGAGGETPTTPEVPATPAAAAPAASLPFTANNTPVVALVASAIATVTAVVSVIVKSALVKQL